MISFTELHSWTREVEFGVVYTSVVKNGLFNGLELKKNTYTEFYPDVSGHVFFLFFLFNISEFFPFLDLFPDCLGVI